MAISEERLQLLLPRRLKNALREQARTRGTTIGAYVRELIEADLRAVKNKSPHVEFPFGKTPLHTGRTHGSVDHDRQGE